MSAATSGSDRLIWPHRVTLGPIRVDTARRRCPNRQPTSSVPFSDVAGTGSDRCSTGLCSPDSEPACPTSSSWPTLIWAAQRLRRGGCVHQLHAWPDAAAALHGHGPRASRIVSRAPSPTRPGTGGILPPPGPLWLEGTRPLVHACPRKAFAPSGPKQLTGLILVTSAGPVARR